MILQGFYIHPRWLLFGISEASTVSYNWKQCVEKFELLFEFPYIFAMRNLNQKQPKPEAISLELGGPETEGWRVVVF